MTTLAACGDTTAAHVASAVSAASGDNQTVSANAAASSPLVVSVLDQNGSTLSGVMVTWSIVTGTGSLSSTISTTNDSGQASVDFTAGADTGGVVVDAIVSGLDAVPFTLTVMSTTDGG
ncbi:MAG TPA: hypothetical protein VGM82_04950 [Gemmatimonadaceae bacterium]